MNGVPFEILGTPQKGGFLIVGDHASNRVPEDIDLGIDPALLSAHIAWDIGVAEVARFITQDARFAAYLGGYSRLVVDLNRDAHDAAAIPKQSDGVVIPGNDLGPKEEEERLERFFWPYHTYLAQLLSQHRPALILSLHSFTPALESTPQEARPWEVGVLYNEQERHQNWRSLFLKTLDILLATSFLIPANC